MRTQTKAEKSDLEKPIGRTSPLLPWFRQNRFLSVDKKLPKSLRGTPYWIIQKYNNSSI